MRSFLIISIFLIACNNGGISLEEAQRLDTLSISDYNRVLRKENDLAMEGMNLLKTAGEDTAAMRNLLLVNEEIEKWRTLVKDKLPEGFVPSEEQEKMFEKVLEFKDQFSRFR
jgi:hypothetical protein